MSQFRGAHLIAPLTENEKDRLHFGWVKDEIASAAKSARKQINEQEEMSERHRVALEILSGTPPDYLPGLFCVRHFRTVGGTPRNLGEVRFQLGRLLAADEAGLLFEAVLLDSKLQQALGKNTLAVRLSICEAGAQGACQRLRRAAAAELATAERVLQQVGDRTRGPLSPADLMHFSGLHLPFFRGTLQQRAKTSNVRGGFVYSPQLTFFHPFASDAESALRFLEAEGTELSMRARLYLAQRLLRTAASLNVAGLCHNVYALRHLLILGDGTPVLGFFAAVSEPGTAVPAFAASVDISHGEGQAAAAPLASLEDESWAAGLLAYNLLTGEKPYHEAGEVLIVESGPEGGPQQLSLEGGGPVQVTVRRGGSQLPTFRLRHNHVPEQFVRLISTLLMPEPSIRPTLPQAAEAFPEIFTRLWRP